LGSLGVGVGTFVAAVVFATARRAVRLRYPLASFRSDIMKVLILVLLGAMLWVSVGCDHDHHETHKAEIKVDKD
jgi:hypothetical protein